ncbi:SPOR domain-containing protein [Sphingoaurantiacus capsulatus]|uniref:SPOR domain-containing protein n=1 Tax=Sphingoaurantiacus capsulatus TaxID=1771310 RepID=A0ABV7XCG4_9SPHN
MAIKAIQALLLVATALTAAGCQQGAATKAMNAQPSRGAAVLQAQVQAAAEQQMRGAGIAMAEAKVEVAPADIEARRTLAQVYLASGRFRSAAQAYDDALGLAPGDSALRLKKALALLAQGNAVAAVGELDRIASLPDAGLAYALAGQTARGVELLEAAARGAEASPRIRQNLALAYALDGQWARARVVAAQDLDPQAVEGRMRHWALLASTADPAAQTAGLLAVTPDGGDPGRPIGLAYVAPMAAPAVQVADVAAPPTLTTSPPVQVALRKASLSVPTPAPARQWVVQLGAYDTPELVDSNWATLQRRVGDLLDGRAPSRSEKMVGEKRYYRLSVAGFSQRGAAIDLCEALQARQKDCFVRRVGPAVPQPTRA